MTELEPYPLTPAAISTDPPAQKPTSRRLRALGAALFSLFLPGAGQLYNRQPEKAFGFAFCALALRVILIWHPGLPANSKALFALSAISFLWTTFVVAEAGYVAVAKNPRSSLPPLAAKVTYSVLGAILMFSALGSVRRVSLSGFVSPCDGICPALCKGEPFSVDFNAYSSKHPRCGDLVMIEHGPDRTSNIKRVAGAAGDTTSSDSKGEVPVNGAPLRFPPACGSPARPERASDQPPYEFESAVVPPNSLFVIGDNLSASNDSRWPEFEGPIPLGEVRGKPLFIYWSPGPSRFARQVR